MKERFVLGDEFFDIAQMVQPRNARTMQPPTLRKLFKRFPVLKEECDAAQAEQEWRSHAFIPHSDLGRTTEDDVRLMDAETYWLRVLNLSTTGGKPAKKFPNLSVVIAFVFSIPASNCISERLFSLLTLNKTCHRNQLSNETFSGLVRMKTLLKKENATAATIQFSDKLVQRVLKVRANKKIPSETPAGTSTSQL